MNGAGAAAAEEPAARAAEEIVDEEVAVLGPVGNTDCGGAAEGSGGMMPPTATAGAGAGAVSCDDEGTNKLVAAFFLRSRAAATSKAVGRRDIYEWRAVV